MIAQQQQQQFGEQYWLKTSGRQMLKQKDTNCMFRVGRPMDAGT